MSDEPEKLTPKVIGLDAGENGGAAIPRLEKGQHLIIRAFENGAAADIKAFSDLLLRRMAQTLGLKYQAFYHEDRLTEMRAAALREWHKSKAVELRRAALIPKIKALIRKGGKRPLKRARRLFYSTHAEIYPHNVGWHRLVWDIQAEDLWAQSRSAYMPMVAGRKLISERVTGQPVENASLSKPFRICVDELDDYRNPPKKDDDA